jgi:hypothetical protein
MQTCSVVFVEGVYPRTYDYLIHSSLGEVRVGERFLAEARDTIAEVQVMAVHAAPSKWATKFIFQRWKVGEPIDTTLLASIKVERG